MRLDKVLMGGRETRQTTPQLMTKVSRALRKGCADLRPNLIIRLVYREEGNNFAMK